MACLSRLTGSFSADPSFLPPFSATLLTTFPARLFSSGKNPLSGAVSQAIKTQKAIAATGTPAATPAIAAEARPLAIRMRASGRRLRLNSFSANTA